MAKSIFDKLSDESVVNQIRIHSKLHIENVQRENKKGSGRRKTECAPHLQKYYADGPGNDVVQVSKELKKALNLKKIETGKPVKLLVAEAIVEYLGIE